MSEPTSSIGCLFAIFAVIGLLLLQLLLVATLYAAIPILGIILAFWIWGWDRRGAIAVLIPSIAILVFAILAADKGFEVRAPRGTYRPMLIGAYSLIIAVELAIYGVRTNSSNPAFRKAGKSALVIALISISAGLLLAYITN